MLWLESWDDALWSPSQAGTNINNPLQGALISQFDCGLVILIHPLSNNGLFRIGLLRPNGSGTPEAGPLVTGLVVSGQLLGNMVRSTLVNTIHHERGTNAVSCNSGGDTNLRANLLSRRVTCGETTAGENHRTHVSAVELLKLAAERCY